MISLTGLDDFWAGYDATLARLRTERPSTVDRVAAILNDFQPPSTGVAKFGNYADDRLCGALADAGWQLRFLQHDDLWDAQHPGTGEELHYVKGDVYPGPWADPRSAGYARDYNNGWRAAKRNNARLSFGGPVDRAGQRKVSRAWRDGFYDQAADHPKWTHRQARLAGWDDVGNYLFAEFCEQEWAQELGGLSSHGSAGQQAMDALSAFQAFPSEANWYALGEAVGAMREAAQPSAVPASPDPAASETAASETAAAPASVTGQPAAVLIRRAAGASRVDRESEATARDFPNPVTPGTRAGRTSPPSAPSQASLPPARRTL